SGHAKIYSVSMHYRSSKLCQVLAVLMVFALSLYRPHLRSVAWPVIVLLCALAVLESFQWLSLDREYQRTQLRHRIFWHNVGIGFAVNPELARKYELDVDDMPMMKLVRRRLVETNRADELSLVFMPA